MAKVREFFSRCYGYIKSIPGRVLFALLLVGAFLYYYYRSMAILRERAEIEKKLAILDKERHEALSVIDKEEASKIKRIDEEYYYELIKIEARKVELDKLSKGTLGDIANAWNERITNERSGRTRE